MVKVRLVWLAAIFLATTLCRAGETTVFVSKTIRIQVLSPTLVRIEGAGPKGFEDRPTFIVANRDWPSAKSQMFKPKHGNYRIRIGKFSVVFPPGARSIQEVKVLDDRGKLAYSAPQQLATSQFFPAPSHFPSAYSIADSPRLIPPKWGAAPAPDGASFPSTSGWDTTNPAPDVYVFLNSGGGYRQFIADYLKLTGPIELPPLFAFGLIDSRYHPYTQAQAVAVVDKYREHGFPLDMFVLDTDWRQGASKGYAVNTKLWPDLGQFIRDMRSKGVRTMFNDHPEPQSDNALDPKELEYRWTGLTSLLSLGADVWWYDRNWITHLKEPVPGLKAEIWGQRLFHDITQKFRPEQRPMIMANVEGIDNGIRNGAPQPSFHRYPIYWTGDTGAQWPYLQRGIANAVDGGVESQLPFMSEDLTGHWGHPTPELYVRFMEFGCLSPITRIHCTAGETRFPWDFGAEAESITRDYVRMRYRLLPTLYSAAWRTHVDGTPILRRCDLVWPNEKRSMDDQQYMLGDDIFVAPVNLSKDGDPGDIPPQYFHTKEGQLGLKGEYFANKKTDGVPLFTRTDPNIGFDWGEGSPDPQLGIDGFSVRWTGVLGPVPESGDFVIGTRTDDGVKLFLDGRQVVSKWAPQDGVTNIKVLPLEKGKSYDIEFDYFEDKGQASAHLLWTPPSSRHDLAIRKFWLPPGQWTDAWSLKRAKGPQLIERPVPLDETPLFVADGGIVILGNEVESTSQNIWREPALDVYVPAAAGSTERTLAEDDGTSVKYLAGESSRTKVTLTRTTGRVRLTIGPAKGGYSGMPISRPWKIRFNLPEDMKVTSVKVDGILLPGGLPYLSPLKKPGSRRMPFMLSEGHVLNLASKRRNVSRTVELVLKKPGRS